MERVRSILLGLTVSLCLTPSVAVAKLKILVDTTADAVDADPGDGVCADAGGDCTLRAAVEEANASGTAVVIVLRHGLTYVLSVPGANEDAALTGDLDVTGRIAIVGNNASLDAGGIDRIFDVQSAGSLSITRLRLVDGAVANQSGGAIRSREGKLVLSRVTIADSSANGVGASGGAIHSESGSLVLDRSTISDCAAERAGGAIEIDGGDARVDRSVIVDNATGASPGNGGGLHVTGIADVLVRRSSFERNTAAAEGGGLWNGAGTMRIDKTGILGNDAEGDAADQGGGGVFNSFGTLVIRRSEVAQNQAGGVSGSGGGILSDGGRLEVSNSTIRANTASRAGGGVELVSGVASLEKSRILENSTGNTPGNGGGLHVTGVAEVLVRRSSFERNTAAAEGGGLWNGAGTMRIEKTRILDNDAQGNAADQGGGGVFNDSGTLVIRGSEVAINRADGTAGSGGGILSDGGRVEVSKSTIRSNAAARAGGGVEIVSADAALQKTRVLENSTGPSPGNGGGLHLTAQGSVTIDRGRFVNNAADAEGGGVWNCGSADCEILVTRTQFAQNAAPSGPNGFNDDGAGILSLDGDAIPAGSGF